MAEREVWEIVAERYGMYRRMLGKDGYRLTEGLAMEVFKGLNEAQIKEILLGHQLKADKFFGNDEFWLSIQEKLKGDE